MHALLKAFEKKGIKKGDPVDLEEFLQVFLGFDKRLSSSNGALFVLILGCGTSSCSVPKNKSFGKGVCRNCF